jgi:serine/threonine protein kinase
VLYKVGDRHDMFSLFVLTLFAACQSIYSVGYIHRNISSSNIILSADGSKGVLIDFESARVFKETPLSGDERRDNAPVGYFLLFK